MWFKFSRIILRNRLLILILLGLITAFMAYRSRFVTMSYQLAQMLPKTDSTYIEYEQFKNKFGKDGSIVVVGTNDKNLFELENFNAWYDLTYNIKNIKVDFVKDGKDTIVNGITEALSIANLYTLIKNTEKKHFDFEQIVKEKPKTQSELDSLKKVLYNLPFYEGYLFTDSSSATIMVITIDSNVLSSKYRDVLFNKIYDEVHSFQVKTGIEIHKSGLPFIRAN